MNYLDTHFIELDKKWLAIRNKKNIEEIESATNKKLDGEFYLGYSYIDHFSGRSIALIGAVRKNNKIYEPTFKPEELKSNISKIDDVYMKESSLEVDILKSKEINKMLKGAIETYIKDCFYTPLHKSMKKIRKYKNLDKHRAYHNPDNINIMLEKEDVWCSIVGENKNKIHAILINTPTKNDKIKRDDLLILEYNKEIDKYIAIENFHPIEKGKEEIKYNIYGNIKSYIYEGE